MSPAISITLYDKDDEPIKTYGRPIIPWGMLRKATRLMDQFDETKPETSKKKKWFWQKEESTNVRPEERQMEAISQFVVDLFGNQFTVKELEAGADIGEIMTVFQSVITRANAAMKSNPTIRHHPKKTYTPKRMMVTGCSILNVWWQNGLDGRLMRSIKLTW